ncbi:MAG: hypothetical protein R3A79_04810 [Nannocystaceae bacterium]
MRLNLIPLACLPLVAALAGCTTDPGNLEIPFSIGSSSVTCETAEVATVEMTLVEISDEGDEPVEYTGSAPCTDGSVSFPGVAASEYDLFVTAKTSDGTVVFDNQDPTSLKKVEALEGQTVTTEEVRLSPTPARILVRWELTKGGAQVQCGGVDTKQFKVFAYTADGITTLLDAEAIACDADPAESPYHVVPDPDRQLDGTRVGQVEVIAQDGGGATVGAPSVVMLAEAPGRGAAIKIKVACVDEVCEASLE